MSLIRRYPEFLVITVILTAVAIATVGVSDYAKFYRCGELAFISGGNPYACEAFVQVPPVLWLMAPFALLPQPLDAWVWGAVVVASVVGSLAIFVNTLGLTDRASLRFLLVLAVSPFSIFLILFHQLSALILLLEAIIFWAMARNRPMIAALAVAASMVKPHLTLFLAPLLAAANRKAQVTAVLLGGIGLTVLTLPYIGLMWDAWNTANDSDAGKHSSVAIRELIPGGVDGWSLPTIAITLIPLALAVWFSIALLRKGKWDLLLAAKLMAVGLLWIPYNRAYDWVLLIPAYLILWQAYGRVWTPALRWAVFLAWIALPFSTLTFFLSIPLSINPIPVIVLAALLMRLPADALEPTVQPRAAAEQPSPTPVLTTR